MRNADRIRGDHGPARDLTGRRQPSRRFAPDAATSSLLEGRTLLSTTINPLPDAGGPLLLNNAGDVVSTLRSTTDKLGYDGSSYLYQPGSTPTRIGFLPGDTTNAVVALNDAGQVAGDSSASSNPGQTHAFLFSRADGLVGIGTLPGYSASQPTALSAGAWSPGSTPTRWEWPSGSTPIRSPRLPPGRLRHRRRRPGASSMARTSA